MVILSQFSHPLTLLSPIREAATETYRRYKQTWLLHFSSFKTILHELGAEIKNLIRFFFF